MLNKNILVEQPEETEIYPSTISEKNNEELGQKNTGETPPNFLKTQKRHKKCLSYGPDSLKRGMNLFSVVSSGMLKQTENWLKMCMLPIPGSKKPE